MRSELETLREQMKREQTEVADNRPQQRKQEDEDKLQKKTKEGGITIVPLKLFINDRGLAKLEIALAKGKKTYDKRETLKLKDDAREMDRARKF